MRAVQETGDKILDDLHSDLRRVRNNTDWRKKRPVRGSYPLEPKEQEILTKIAEREVVLGMMAQQGGMAMQLESSP